MTRWWTAPTWPSYCSRTLDNQSRLSVYIASKTPCFSPSSYNPANNFCMRRRNYNCPDRSPGFTGMITGRCGSWRRLAPICWMLTIQYFVAQIVVAVAAKSIYNWGTDPISYLGITECGFYDNVYVCSPLHALFNLSMIGLGVAMGAGVFLFYHQFKKSPGTLLGFSALAVAALGSLLVGVFPANTLMTVHKIGSGLAFIGALVGLLTLGVSLRELPHFLRYLTLVSGVIVLAGLTHLALLFFTGIGFKGVAERTVSYTEVLWLFVFGLYFQIRQITDPGSRVDSHQQ